MSGNRLSRQNSGSQSSRDRLKQIRSLYDVLTFSFVVLHRGSLLRLIALLLLMAISIIVLITHIEAAFAPGLKSAVAGIALLDAIHLYRELKPSIVSLLRFPNYILVKDPGTDALLQSLQLHPDYKRDRYELVGVPFRDNEYVVRSDFVDQELRARDFQIVHSPAIATALDQSLQDRPDILDKVLRVKRDSSARLKKAFVNELKTCMGDDLFASSTSIRIYRGSYYHSFLTNEYCTHALETDDANPRIQFSGLVDFPANREASGENRLANINGSTMGNHIGISSIVYTSDGMLNFWRQSQRAQQSAYLLAPTGSGSCDWSDWQHLQDKGSLRELIAVAMQREFLEESSLKRTRRLCFHKLPPDADSQVDTEILGYCRWVRRGGKPEFFGLSRANFSSSDLIANVEEVDSPKNGELLKLRVKSLDDLQEVVSELLAAKALSVPLWVNLTCLSKALLDDPNRWSKFLRLDS